MAQEISYSQHQLASDGQFAGRIMSVLKDDQAVPVGVSAADLAWRIIEDVAAEPGLAESYHAALIAIPPIRDPGASSEVITDPVLIAAVAAVMDRYPSTP